MSFPEQHNSHQQQQQNTLVQASGEPGVHCAADRERKQKLRKFLFSMITGSDQDTKKPPPRVTGAQAQQLLVDTKEVLDKELERPSSDPLEIGDMVPRIHLLKDYHERKLAHYVELVGESSDEKIGTIEEDDDPYGLRPLEAQDGAEPPVLSGLGELESNGIFARSDFSLDSNDRSRVKMSPNGRHAAPTPKPGGRPSRVSLSTTPADSRRNSKSGGGARGVAFSDSGVPDHFGDGGGENQRVLSPSLVKRFPGLQGLQNHAVDELEGSRRTYSIREEDYMDVHEYERAQDYEDKLLDGYLPLESNSSKACADKNSWQNDPGSRGEDGITTSASLKGWLRATRRHTFEVPQLGKDRTSPVRKRNNLVVRRQRSPSSPSPKINSPRKGVSPRGGGDGRHGSPRIPALVSAMTIPEQKTPERKRIRPKLQTTMELIKSQKVITLRPMDKKEPDLGQRLVREKLSVDVETLVCPTQPEHWDLPAGSVRPKVKIFRQATGEMELSSRTCVIDPHPKASLASLVAEKFKTITANFSGAGRLVTKALVPVLDGQKGTPLAIDAADRDAAMRRLNSARSDRTQSPGKGGVMSPLDPSLIQSRVDDGPLGGVGSGGYTTPRSLFGDSPRLGQRSLNLSACGRSSSPMADSIRDDSGMMHSPVVSQIARNLTMSRDIRRTTGTAKQVLDKLHASPRAGSPSSLRGGDSASSFRESNFTPPSSAILLPSANPRTPATGVLGTPPLGTPRQQLIDKIASRFHKKTSHQRAKTTTPNQNYRYKLTPSPSMSSQRQQRGKGGLPPSPATTPDTTPNLGPAAPPTAVVSPLQKLQKLTSGNTPVPMRVTTEGVRLLQQSSMVRHKVGGSINAKVKVDLALGSIVRRKKISSRPGEVPGFVPHS